MHKSIFIRHLEFLQYNYNYSLIQEGDVRASKQMLTVAAASVACGITLSVTADASPLPHSPPRTDRAAVCIATSPDAQAVSVLMQGPWRPSENDIRPHAIEIVSAVTV